MTARSRDEEARRAEAVSEALVVSAVPADRASEARLAAQAVLRVVRQPVGMAIAARVIAVPPLVVRRHRADRIGVMIAAMPAVDQIVVMRVAALVVLPLPVRLLIVGRIGAMIVPRPAVVRDASSHQAEDRIAAMPDVVPLPDHRVRQPVRRGAATIAGLSAGVRMIDLVAVVRHSVGAVGADRQLDLLPPRVLVEVSSGEAGRRAVGIARDTADVSLGVTSASAGIVSDIAVLVRVRSAAAHGVGDTAASREVGRVSLTVRHREDRLVSDMTCVVVADLDVRVSLRDGRADRRPGAIRAAAETIDVPRRSEDRNHADRNHRDAPAPRLWNRSSIS